MRRVGTSAENQIGDLGENIPKNIIEQMKESANYQLKRIRKDFGQELDAFSHGKAYFIL